jgi:hypothetical protein
MKQEFVEFYKNKTDLELYRIFTGKVLDSYNNRKLAQEILTERGFDFDNIDKYSDKWELEKLLKDVEEENRAWWTGPSLFDPNNLLIFGIMAVVGPTIIFAASMRDFLSEESRNAIDILTNVLFYVLFIVAGIATIIYSKKRRRQKNERSLRIDELTRKLLNNK